MLQRVIHAWDACRPCMPQDRSRPLCRRVRKPTGRGTASRRADAPSPAGSRPLLFPQGRRTRVPPLPFGLADSRIAIRNRLGPRRPIGARRPFGRPLAAPVSPVAPPGSSPRVASPDASARLRLSVFMVFAAGSRPCGPASLSKDHGCASPHRRGAVTAKRAKRSGAAAKRLDGDGPMGPPTGDVCIRWPQAVRGKWRVAGSTAMRPALAVQISRSAPGGIAALRAGFDPTRTSVAGD